MTYTIPYKDVMDMYEEFFCLRLAKLREQKGVSAREMSLAIGQNPSYINRIENGKAFPSMQVFFYICEYLGVTPEEFFATATDAPAQVRALTAAFSELLPEQRQSILQLLSAFKTQNSRS